MPDVSPREIYDVRQETIPASDTLEITYPFRPDAIQIILEDPPSLGLRLFVEGSVGGGGMPLLAQGPFIIPGIKENQRIRIVSDELGDMPCTITAWKGHAPTSVATPTLSASAVASTIRAQSPFDSFPSNRTSQAFSFSNPIAGATCVLFAVDQKSGGTEPPISISSVNIGGVPATLIRAQNRGASGVRLEAWVAYGVPAGVQTCTITYAGTANNGAEIMLMFDVGVLVGNSNSRVGVGTFNLVNLDARSSNYGYGEICTETGGAEVVFTGQGPGANQALYRRTQNGLNTWTWSAGGEAIGVEMRLT